MKRTVKKAPFIKYGLEIKDGGIYCGFKISCLKKAGILLINLKSGKKEEIIFDESLSIGDVYSVFIENLDMNNKGYRIISDNETYLDPYSVRVSGLEEFGKPVNPSTVYSLPSTPVKVTDYSPLKIPYEDSVFYLTHVRGYSMKSRSKERGTFLYLSHNIDKLKKLGITTLELMPVNEYIDTEFSNEPLTIEQQIKTYTKDLNNQITEVNYWGYKKAFHFALKSSLSFSPDANNEFKELVDTLHDNNMEIVLQMYFVKDTPKDYIIEALINFVTVYNVDGFRILGENIPFEDIAVNPFLKGTKIMGDFDFDSIYKNQSVKYKNLARYNDYFMNMSRRFLKGDEDMVSSLSYLIREQSKSEGIMRYITDYYGFTLNDLVSYERKHNELNNWNNTDGADYNYSWNCNFEGPTSKRNINKLRNIQLRNAMLIVLLSQGTPVIRGGDEFLNTQFGNNNPYCQDNETGWQVNPGTKSASEFTSFLTNLIAFRMRHKILRQPMPLKMVDYMSCKVPDASYHSSIPWAIDCNAYSREFGILYYGDYEKQYSSKASDSVYIIYNMNWQDRDFVLPLDADIYEYRLLYSSDGSTDESFDEDKAKPIKTERYIAKGRSISIILIRKTLD